MSFVLPPARNRLLGRDRPRLFAILAVTAMHVVAVLILQMAAPARRAVTDATAFMVTLIREQPAAVARPTELPKPLPVKPMELRPEPVPVPLVVTASLPTDISAPPPVPQPAAQPVRPLVTSPAQTAAASVAPPRFDADYLDNPAPAYPRRSKRLGEVGSVLLMVYVQADGRPGQIDIQSSSRFERLDQAAIEAVRRWKFVAAKQGEKTIAAWVLVPIHFSLKS